MGAGRAGFLGTMAGMPPRFLSKANLYDDSAAPASGERFESLLQCRNVVVERIISSAQALPSEFVQTQDEWVLLVRGTATLDVDGTAVQLGAGDHLFLPAGTPHTVRQVSEGALWLAVHVYPAEPPGRGERHSQDASLPTSTRSR